MNFKINLYEKILLMALLLPLSAFEMSADNPNPVIKKIPLLIGQKVPIKRTQQVISFESYFYGPMSCIHTIVLDDLGEVEINVTNASTGEFWTATFDTSVDNQYSLQISTTSGLYEVEYTTASGDIYEGEFIIE